jgi:zinc protease
LNLASIVFGGSFTSRLNANLREEKGFTYGASARASDDPLFGLLTLNTPVKAEVTGASIVEILKELKRIERKDITSAETQKARKIFRTKIIESISTLSQLLDKVASQSIKGSDFYDIDKKLKVSEGIGESLLNDLAAKHFDTNRALWVLVGDKDEILKQLKGLGFPEPEIYKL